MLDHEWIVKANCQTMSTKEFMSRYVSDPEVATALFEFFEVVESDPEQPKDKSNLEVAKFANLYFEGYEEDKNIAQLLDDVCLSCPVISDCFNHGLSNSEHGVWGGVYLVDGEINQTRNAHKTDEVWQQLLDVLGEI